MSDSTSQPDASSSPTSVEEKMALYSFHPFTDSELSTVAKACEEDGYENGGNENFIAAAPKPHFLESEATIENIMSYHRGLAENRRQPVIYDPNYFIVVKSPQWKKEGVLVVTMNKSDLKYVPDDGKVYEKGWDSWMFTAKSSGLTILNLQLANMGWEEFTTWEDVQPEGQEVDQRRGQTWYEMNPE